VIVGPALLYATSGLAVAEEHINESNTLDPALSNPGSDVFSASRAMVGWVVGGGAEYRIHDHWSVKGEYLYARFQALDGVSTTSSPYFAVTIPIYYGHHVSLNTQLARVVFEYKFDWMAPPEAVSRNTEFLKGCSRISVAGRGSQQRAPFFILTSR
jgi:opacity protein-like surface antigen